MKQALNVNYDEMLTTRIIDDFIFDARSWARLSSELLTTRIQVEIGLWTDEQYLVQLAEVKLIKS